MIVIIDYGMGNLRTIFNKLEKLKAQAIISSKVEEIEKADKLILPGVGAFAVGIDNLKRSNIISVLNDKVIQEKTPILGICLGAQLFTRGSEEGNAHGLGWIAADTKRFNFDKPAAKLKIPHMGWNSLQIKKESPLLRGITNNSKFYFLHSFYITCEDKNDIVATTQYGLPFVSVMQKSNVLGVQFHPETSHKDGFRILKNFVEFTPHA